MQPIQISSYEDFEEFVFIERPPSAWEKLAAILTKKELPVEKTESSEPMPF